MAETTFSAHRRLAPPPPARAAAPGSAVRCGRDGGRAETSVAHDRRTPQPTRGNAKPWSPKRADLPCSPAAAALHPQCCSPRAGTKKYRSRSTSITSALGPGRAQWENRVQARVVGLPRLLSTWKRPGTVTARPGALSMGPPHLKSQRPVSPSLWYPALGLVSCGNAFFVRIEDALRVDDAGRQCRAVESLRRLKWHRNDQLAFAIALVIHDGATSQ
ncbi:hypothetical protein PCL_03568 [Purpureocillium lilacinum]|uniref:Uncharacterized protein n=1 Tax=Purpureocillium lilacinum TaxID=33203 RepID=A0A2U3EPE6_PURLI|nr:hypothetical protein PCL_03568 [Purpureocillium lilacinum]